MDVMHRQVEEYENEIRFLKDAKSPAVKRALRTTRRSYTDLSDGRRSGEDLQNMASSVGMGVFEAALFRPALQAARRDASHWKSKATAKALIDLPPLNVPKYFPSDKNQEEKVAEEDMQNPFLQLSSALYRYRVETASVKVVDLSKATEQSPRAAFRDSIMRKASAAERLDEAAASARQWLQLNAAKASGNVAQSDLLGHPLVGRVKIGGGTGTVVPTPTSREDLLRLQLHITKA
jgi:hypothetical protein